jgi:DnaJ-class molecular chaperone
MKNFVICKKCNGTGWFLSKKHDWTYGSYKPCNKCLGCGGVTYISETEFREILKRA